MRLKSKVSFDPQAELGAIADFARRWRSLFRPAEVAYTPAHFTAELEKLERAKRLRLYLVTRPEQPVALAILDGLDQEQVIELLALAPLDGEDEVRPWLSSPSRRREMMAQAPAEPSGRGVFPFLVGEPEGLVLAMARWGHLNVLDPEPLLAQRLALLGRRIQSLGKPDQ
ncbi:MAG: hypothetical protein KMY53_17305 [Desulfarculus sp.]|nr:hypothetical protein [Pseudomonadota bacterium]MBV1715034.1 hypothetical protein [Desulfarculus sp.]MBU4573323.1 hypothetical protein [Pseudomonadota bacterium]MBU4599693.1 hypothetical protein [Pseudomonadota bacterium]MBV1739922.1 hypothetical protein [Desulfarculus sp.]